MINEKECREALEHIKTLRGSNYGWYYSGFNNSALPFDEDTNVISKLIEEHFDNPPLKWEELKEKTWYWHEPSTSWIYLFKPLNWEPVKGLRYAERIIQNSCDGYYMDFKEGQLYRKEVQ